MWGKTTCPGGKKGHGRNVTTLFSGEMAGSHYNHKGGTSSLMCIKSGEDVDSRLYGNTPSWQGGPWSTDFTRVTSFDLKA